MVCCMGADGGAADGWAVLLGASTKGGTGGALTGSGGMRGSWVEGRCSTIELTGGGSAGGAGMKEGGAGCGGSCTVWISCVFICAWQDCTKHFGAPGKFGVWHLGHLTRSSLFVTSNSCLRAPSFCRAS